MLAQKIFVREKTDSDDTQYLAAERNYPGLLDDDDGSDIVEVGEYKLVRTLRIRQLVEEVK